MVLLVHGLPCILLDGHDKSTFQRLEALTLHFATFGHRPGAAGRLSILEHVSLNSIIAGAALQHAILLSVFLHAKATCRRWR